ncbi:AAA domain-containing protein [Cryobacterium serini]|uniref:Protein kinase domain-containing protein n=1 Tax=Cryobacterium serini TaxID=1259201 RepID=A0A4R9BTV1_9MICO|nr:AAA domain-containing protein [Cryobacterium serini]TFD89787.1 hypothetical protein E3T51_03450 [Cryobacterium serini]
MPAKDTKQRTGGQASVIKCIDTHNAQIVAVKIIEGLFRDEIASKIFERETGALKRLTHRNIVGYRTSGYDEDGRMYIVLDWIEDSLETVLQDRGSIPWDEMLAKIVRPLADGLSYMHLNKEEHRDIKPANILINADGVPLFADFGVGKSRANNEDESEMTIHGFRSGIWTPPERSAVPYVRDVYSLAVVFIRAVCTDDIQDAYQLASAVESMLIPVSLKELLLRCIDADPDVRPANGSVFAAELESMIRSDQQRHSSSLTVNLHLTRAATTKIGGPFSTPEQTKSIVQTDVSGDTFVSYGWDRDQERFDRETLILLGESTRYVLKADGPAGALMVVDATNPEYEALEHTRDRSLRLPASVNWSLTQARSNPGFEILQHRLDAYYDADSMDPSADTGADSSTMTSTWRNLLNAREDLERGDRKPLTYVTSEPTRYGTRFELNGPPEEDLVGSEWQVRRSDVGRGGRARGEIVDQSDTAIVLRWSGKAPVSLSKAGVLEPHLGSSQVGLQRQSDAVSALETGTGAAQWLKGLLEDPTTALPPVASEEPEWVTNLDDDKRAAVRGALGAPECVILKGPPGTGKTRFIAEFVIQLLAREPDARVLIVSQTHVAVDNALSRLDDAGLSGLVRLGKEDDARIGMSSQHLVLHRQLSVWASLVRQRAEDHLSALSGQAGLSVKNLKAMSLLHTLRSSMKNSEYVRSRLPSASSDQSTMTSELGLRNDAVTLQDKLDSAGENERALLNSALALLDGEVPLGDDPALDDVEAAIELLSDRSDAAPHLLRMLKLQSEWLERVESDSSLAAEYLKTTSVIAGTCIGFLGNPLVRNLEIGVCIVDEASKATSTEALVPVVRAKRFVLVGDLNQLPPSDEELLQNQDLLDQYSLTQEDVKESLFQRLVERLPEANQFALLQQHRMIKPIGDLVSTCFYSGELRSPNVMGLPGYESLGKPVLWLDTSTQGAQRLESSEAGSKGRFINRAEAELVAHRLGTIDAGIATGIVQLPPNAEVLDVLVLASYSSQIEQLRRRLARERFSNLKITIETVDAVQGKEADIALFSTTRSNTHGGMGFMGPDYWRRINVAVSRARFGLTIVGDASFWSSGGLGSVLQYMRSNVDTCEIRSNNG